MRHPALSTAGLALTAALLLTACGGADDGGSEPSATEDAAFPRTVEHAMGSTEIPERPERVVVLDTGELDTALSLGVTPVGAVTTAVSEDFLTYLADDAADVEVVGTIAEPNLEAIAALEPDLILSSRTRHEDIYEELAQIAPTVFADRVGAVWKENFLLDAEALGLEDEAEELLEAYESDAAALGEEIGDPAGTTVSTARFVEGTIRVYTAESFIGTVMADIGLDHLQLPTDQVPTFAELSAEEVSQVDADIVLYSSYGAAGDSGEAAVVAGPLWPRLTAVTDGRAFAVEDDVFYTGIGLRAATLQLEELRELLVE
ncbi:ABC transporter substrate-binding protein [Blastococcus haudaquaticus]|uniref:Iron complex transport system substrate-binding protein n=1 Tax=Blastococcus haudaquaticus TaxID=1938745 RepID=A0A286H9Y6_9ACTN|nr:iron-siderophore ABC transporter substrate-binding protein [Blastococcus haudaquaticus]SOE04064.1 iron complex transport system substrate-binding protein [Blastococcus haudaquaticus]